MVMFSLDIAEERPMKYMYIGLLVVIVMAILLIAIPVSLIYYQQTREASRRAEVIANLRELGEALARYDDQEIDPLTGPLFQETHPEAIRQASEVLAERLDLSADKMPVELWQAALNSVTGSITVTGETPSQKQGLQEFVEFEIVFTRRMKDEEVVWIVRQLTLDGQQILGNEDFDWPDLSTPAAERESDTAGAKDGMP